VLRSLLRLQPDQFVPESFARRFQAGPLVLGSDLKLAPPCATRPGRRRSCDPSNPCSVRQRALTQPLEPAANVPIQRPRHRSMSNTSASRSSTAGHVSIAQEPPELGSDRDVALAGRLLEGRSVHDR